MPIQLRLEDNRGLEILKAGSPFAQVRGCGGGSLNAIEQTVTAGNSSLSYDATADQYIYVWKTDKAWTGTCRQFILTLNDGTTHVANFQFK